MKLGVNLTGTIYMSPDGHNLQSLLDLNRSQEWQHLHCKHLISAGAQVCTVNVDTPSRFHVESRLPVIIEIETLALSFKFKSLKSVLHLLSPL